MPSQSQITRLMSELTRLTSKSMITWRVSDPPESMRLGTDDVFPLYFETEFKDQKIGLAQRRFRIFDGEHERFFWDEELLLVFVDGWGRVTWQTTSPRTALANLFDSAREQVANVDGVLRRLLSDEDEAL